MITPRDLIPENDDIDDVGSWQVTATGGMLLGGLGVVGINKGVCLITGLALGLMLAGRPGELCGLGGWDGLNGGAGRIGGL